MANKQETLIYAEKEHYTEAEFMSRSFVNKETKNRAYVNAFGAELVIKYLTTEGFDTSDLNNIHSVSKILESIDIADIMLPNIHIDVRTVFDEKQIFIPKSHFELEITPDIYVAIKLSEDFKHAELLGYFKPSQINKQNANREYYFIEKDKLSSADSLSKFIKDYKEGKKVKVLNTNANWYGITYREDLDEVKDAIEDMIERGEYPYNLWS